VPKTNRTQKPVRFVAANERNGKGLRTQLAGDLPDAGHFVVVCPRREHAQTALKQAAIRFWSAAQQQKEAANSTKDHNLVREYLRNYLAYSLAGCDEL
jgi:hypothetical protein